MSQDDKSLFEETIRPIERPRPGVAGADSTARSSRHRKFWLFAAATLLALLLVGVFVFLPGANDGAQRDVVPETAIQAAVEGPPPLSSQERAELDAQSQRDLASLLTQQDRLLSQGVEQWGGDAWRQYQDMSRNGDDAYLADDLRSAAAAYEQALAVGNELLVLSERMLESAIEGGRAALAAAEPDEALAQFEVALAIDADNIAARTGTQRAERLPAVLELMRRAGSLESDGDLPGALDLYREALAIDPLWMPAQQALAAAEGDLEAYRYGQFLSQGYAALSASRFAEAVDHFTKARALRPNSSEVADGLFQAEEGLRLGQIALARVRALAFETRELWLEAIAQYEAALQTDATLEYAIEGLARSRARRDLEVKILNLLENPRLLFDDAVLNDAQSLRAEAAQIDPRGAQLEQQLADLDRLIAAATAPLPVQLVSDGLTNVTVYRVGTLGTFTATQIDLRPGNYTALGSRNGYRDVRKSFTVLPGRELDPVDVICVEPI